MAKSHDLSQPPTINMKAWKFAQSNGLQVFHVICDQRIENVFTGVMFYGVGPCVPRLGEEIRLENGTLCRVTRVLYGVTTSDEVSVVTPTVYCEPT